MFYWNKASNLPEALPNHIILPYSEWLWLQNVNYTVFNIEFIIL